MKLIRWKSLLVVTAAMASAPLFAQNVQELQNGVGKGGSQARAETPWAGQQASLDAVKELQQKLNDNGYDSGPVDGLVGPKTQSALRAFQQDQGLQASGEIDAETLNAMGIDRSEFAAFGIKEESTDQTSPDMQQNQPDSGKQDTDGMRKEQY